MPCMQISGLSLGGLLQCWVRACRKTPTLACSTQATGARTERVFLNIRLSRNRHDQNAAHASPIVKLLKKEPSNVLVLPRVISCYCVSGFQPSALNIRASYPRNWVIQNFCGSSPKCLTHHWSGMPVPYIREAYNEQAAPIASRRQMRSLKTLMQEWFSCVSGIPTLNASIYHHTSIHPTSFTSSITSAQSSTLSSKPFPRQHQSTLSTFSAKEPGEVSSSSPFVPSPLKPQTTEIQRSQRPEPLQHRDSPLKRTPLKPTCNNLCTLRDSDIHLSLLGCPD